MSRLTARVPAWVQLYLPVCAGIAFVCCSVPDTDSRGPKGTDQIVLYAGMPRVPGNAIPIVVEATLVASSGGATGLGGTPGASADGSACIGLASTPGAVQFPFLQPCGMLPEPIEDAGPAPGLQTAFACPLEQGGKVNAIAAYLPRAQETSATIWGALYAHDCSGRPLAEVAITLKIGATQLPVDAGNEDESDASPDDAGPTSAGSGGTGGSGGTAGLAGEGGVGVSAGAAGAEAGAGG